jgi:hypothetical protein
MPNANVAGDTIPTCALWGTSAGAPASPSSISDTYNGSAYSLISASLEADGNFSMECAYSQSIDAGAAGNTLTYHFPSATGSQIQIMAAEVPNIAGLGPLDQVAVAVTTGANPTCPSITPSTSKWGVVVFCFIEGESTGATYTGGTSGGCALSACTLVVGNSSQGMEWAYQATPAAITLNFGSATTRRAIAVSVDFVLGTNNGPASQNHVDGPLDLYIGNGEISTADSLLLSGVTGAIGEAGPKEVRDVTATVNNGFSGTAPTELIRVSGTGTTFDNIHLENWAGANSYGFGLGEDAGAKGITINNLNSGNASSGTALLYISGAFNSNGITITNLNAVGGGYPTDLMIDALDGCTDPITNESVISIYALGSPGGIVGGYQRFSSSSYAGCASQFGELIYQVDDGPLCRTYNTGGANTCTNSSLTNPTPGQPEIVVAFPPGTTSITVQTNGVGAKTVPIVAPAPWASTLLSASCVQPATFVPTWPAQVTSITPYVAGTTLGSITIQMGSSYGSAPYCVAIYLRGFDQ